MNFEKIARRNTERRSFDEQKVFKARKGKLNKTQRGGREEWAA